MITTTENEEFKSLPELLAEIRDAINGLAKEISPLKDLPLKDLITEVRALREVLAEALKYLKEEGIRWRTK